MRITVTVEVDEPEEDAPEYTDASNPVIIPEEPEEDEDDDEPGPVVSRAQALLPRPSVRGCAPRVYGFSL